MGQMKATSTNPTVTTVHAIEQQGFINKFKFVKCVFHLWPFVVASCDGHKSLENDAIGIKDCFVGQAGEAINRWIGRFGIS